jgi:hypothetical protein
MIIMILISYQFISIIDDDNLILVALFKVITDIWSDILDFPDGTSTILQKKIGWCTNDRPKIRFLEDQTTIDGQICSEQTTQDFPDSQSSAQSKCQEYNSIRL